MPQSISQTGTHLKCNQCGLAWVAKTPGAADRTTVQHFKDCPAKGGKG